MEPAYTGIISYSTRCQNRRSYLQPIQSFLQKFLCLLLQGIGSGKDFIKFPLRRMKKLRNICFKKVLQHVLENSVTVDPRHA